MQPECPRCRLPMSPLETRPSHDGPVHPGCLRPTDAVPLSPVHVSHDIVGPAPVPAYGLPPWSPARIGPIVIAVAGGVGAWWYLHHH